MGQVWEVNVRKHVVWIGSVVSAMSLAIVLAQHAGAPATETAPSSSSPVAAATRSIADGIYTNTQATRGKTVYDAQCAACHGPDLKGGVALVGEGLLKKWAPRTVGEFFDYVKANMPFGRGNTLTAAQTADVLAYIFQQNQFPAGRALLPSDSRILREVAFDKQAQAAAAAQSQQAQKPAAPAAPVASVGEGLTAASGVFTEAQAARGEKIFTDAGNACSGCHGAALGGSPGGPGLVRGQFKSKWGGRTVGEMADYIIKAMPPGRAGTINEQGAADIMAFILKNNNFAAGTAELPASVLEMKKIVIPK